MTNKDILHDHECHEHEHQHSPIAVMTHESGVVGSFEIKFDQPYDTAVKLAEQFLKKIGYYVNENGGIIGHIKAVIKTCEKSCMLSITDDEIHKRNLDCCISHLEGVAIVFQIETQKMENILKLVFHGYI